MSDEPVVRVTLQDIYKQGQETQVRVRTNGGVVYLTEQIIHRAVPMVIFTSRLCDKL